MDGEEDSEIRWERSFRVEMYSLHRPGSRLEEAVGEVTVGGLGKAITHDILRRSRS